jgi:hypothetical protein
VHCTTVAAAAALQLTLISRRLQHAANTAITAASRQLHDALLADSIHQPHAQQQHVLVKKNELATLTLSLHFLNNVSSTLPALTSIH